MMIAVSTVQECFAVLDNGDGFPGEMVAGNNDMKTIFGIFHLERW